MTIQIRKAERRKAKLRLGIAGPSGAGKTMGALKVAKGIGSKIIMIDTERGSGDLYADLYNYDIITLTPPYKPSAYVEAIKAAEMAGYEVIIIDSLSHAWSDEGGLLDQADKKNASGNRFTVWAELTPQHRSLVNAMLNSPAHIIATVRSKQDYAIEKDEKTGRSAVKKLGMAPVQREGMEYEFTVFIDVEINHYAHTSKDRTNLFKDEVFLLETETGEKLLKWLNAGKDDPLEQKREIIRQLDRIGLQTTDGMQIRADIAEQTGLALEEKNFAEIIEKLKATKSIEDQIKESEENSTPEDLFPEEETPEENKKKSPADHMKKGISKTKK